MIMDLKTIGRGDVDWIYMAYDSYKGIFIRRVEFLHY